LEFPDPISGEFEIRAASELARRPIVVPIFS
jgi:hypothetical protein